MASVTLLIPTACGRTIETIIDCASPDGTFQATFYWVHGGGAAGSATFKLAIRNSGDSLNSRRDVLIMRHGHDVHIRWVSASELLVEYPDRAGVDMRKEAISSVGHPPRTVRVDYSPVDTVSVNSIPGGTRCSGP